MDPSQDHTRAEDPTLIQDPLISGSSGLVICGRYRLSHMIGSGGMAQVWEATDTVLGRQVAVKMLHAHFADDATFVARFRAEAIAAARLSHPNIVGVFDTCSDGGKEVIVMELLAATTLRKHLDENRFLDVATTVRIALRVLSALEAAHQANLVHRDIKPSNILLCADGRVKIADFGIAKLDGQSDLTQPGGMIGTAAYLAPEQVTDEPVDGRTDLYALGIVMYECLTGTTPFKGDSRAAIAVKRLHVDPVDPRRLRAGIPADFAETVLKTLERNPDDRFGSAADLRAALLVGKVPPTASRPVQPEDTGELPAPAGSFSRSERRWLYPALFLIFVAAALVTAGLLVAGSAQDLSRRSPGTTQQTPTAAPTAIVRAVPFDPQGDGHENDSNAPKAIDGDAGTAWKTEGYEPPGFSGGKTGVGLGLYLKGRSRIDQVSIEGSANGWSGQIFVVDANSLDGFDPRTAQPAATFDDFGGSASVGLPTGPDTATGTVVLIWITDLGQAGGDGRHRVEISSVDISGSLTG